MSPATQAKTANVDERTFQPRNRHAYKFDRSKMNAFRLLFCVLALLLPSGAASLHAQEMVCDSVDQAWFLGQDEASDPAAAGRCSGGPWSISIGDLVHVDHQPIAVLLPNNAAYPRSCNTTRICTGGIDDNFGAPGEPATSSQSLVRALGGCQGVHQEFDTLSKDGECFGHSFLNCWRPGCKVTSAQLEIRMRAERGRSDNDNISIYTGGQRLWISRIENLPQAENHWDVGDEALFIIDLDNLPGNPSSILDVLTDSVGVSVQDDTSVDFMRLTLRFDCCGSTCGTKYLDQNCNSLRDDGEETLAGHTIVLDDGQGDARTVTTGADGSYCFEQVHPGTHSLGGLAQPGWTQTFPPTPGRHTVKVTAGERIDDLDFGNKRCEGCGPSEPIGACCTREGCIQMSFEACREAEGLWAGRNDCTERLCSRRGGCCITSQGQFLTLVQGCRDLGGAWQGAGEECPVTDP